MDITRADVRTAMGKYGTDKLGFHGYDQMYANVFARIAQCDRLLEIGVRRGRSIAAWKELLPNAEIVGLDIAQRDDLLDEAKTATLIYGDSRQTSVKDQVTGSFDLIIDDGDHRPDSQWATFLNFEGKWSRAYIIEDIINLDNEKKMRKRLESKGYKVYTTYKSIAENLTMQISGVITPVTFYSMVVFPKSA